MANGIAPFFRMIRFSHSIFALPFALVAMMIAADGTPVLWDIFWIVVCCIAARTAAMSFNRVVDLKFDRLNPRTKNRELVSGEISIPTTIIMVILSSLVLIFGAAMLNDLAFKLSPAALAIVLFYSYTKRFTAASHVFLGLALAAAPIGAWIAIRGDLSNWIPLVLGAAVLFWTAGFDLIYACQDTDFDREAGLHSIPAHFGTRTALRLSGVSHLISIFLFWLVAPLAGFGNAYLLGVVLITWLLVYEHKIISPSDLSRVNVAFFTINGFISIIFFFCTLAEYMF